jgi:hypothetical protein
MASYPQSSYMPSWYVCLFVFLALQPIVVVFSQPDSGLYPSRFRDFLITHNAAPQSVGLPWTSDQSVAETSTWQHTTLTTNTHAPSGILTHNLSRRAAEDLRLRLRGHWDQPSWDVQGPIWPQIVHISMRNIAYIGHFSAASHSPPFQHHSYTFIYPKAGDHSQ